MERPQDPVLKMISGKPIKRMVLRSDDLPPNRGSDEAIEEVSMNAVITHSTCPTGQPWAVTDIPISRQLYESPTVQLQIPQQRWKCGK